MVLLSLYIENNNKQIKMKKKGFILCTLVLSVLFVAVFVQFSCRTPTAVLSSPSNNNINSDKPEEGEIDVVALLSNQTKSDAIVFVYADWCHYCKLHKQRVHKKMKQWASDQNIMVFDINFEDPKHKDTMTVVNRLANGNIGFPFFCIIVDGAVKTESGYLDNHLRFEKHFQAK